MEIFIKEVELEKNMQKLNVFKNEVNLSLEKVLNSFKEINEEFDTDNKEKFIELCDEEYSKSNVINHYLSDNILVLDKTLEKYRRTAQEVAGQFKNIIE